MLNLFYDITVLRVYTFKKALSLKHWNFLKLQFFGFLFVFLTAHFDNKHSDIHQHKHYKDFHVSRLVFVLMLFFCIMLIINFLLLSHANDYLLLFLHAKKFVFK